MAGEQLVEGASEIFNIVEQLKISIDTNQKQELLVRFGVPPSLSHLFLKVFGDRTEEEKTRIRLQMVEASTFWLQQRLDFGDLDCAILTNGQPSRTLNVRPLWREDLFLVGPTNSIFSTMEKCELCDLVCIPLILTPPQDATRRIIDAAFLAQELIPTVCQELEAMSLLSAHLETNQAYTILSRTVARWFNERLGLVITPISGLNIDRSFALRRGSLTLRIENKIVTAIQSIAREKYQNDQWISFNF